MNVPAITIEDASLSYGDQPVFSHLNLHLEPGKWVALLGPSGAGKSSLLRFMTGLKTANSRWDGRIVASNNLSVTEQTAWMAQTDLLLPWMKVLDNAMLGLKLRPRKTDEDDVEQTQILLELVGLKNTAHLYPHQLSGGMRQRVALVRTLMENKPVVLMDEPFSALDAITRYQLQALAAELMQHKTVLFITHDPAEALRLAHEIYIMQPYPATLKHVTSLSPPVPRTLHQTEIAGLQHLLFAELSGGKMS